MDDDGADPDQSTDVLALAESVIAAIGDPDSRASQDADECGESDPGTETLELAESVIAALSRSGSQLSQGAADEYVESDSRTGLLVTAGPAVAAVGETDSQASLDAESPRLTCSPTLMDGQSGCPVDDSSNDHIEQEMLASAETVIASANAAGDDRSDDDGETAAVDPSTFEPRPALPEHAHPPADGTAPGSPSNETGHQPAASSGEGAADDHQQCKEHVRHIGEPEPDRDERAGTRRRSAKIDGTGRRHHRRGRRAWSPAGRPAHNDGPGGTHRSWTNLLDASWTRLPFLASWETPDCTGKADDRKAIPMAFVTSSLAMPTMTTASLQKASVIVDRLLQAGKLRQQRLDQATRRYHEQQDRREREQCTFRPRIPRPPRRSISSVPVPDEHVEKEIFDHLDETLQKDATAKASKNAAVSSVFARLHQAAQDRQTRQRRKAERVAQETQKAEMTECTFRPSLNKWPVPIAKEDVSVRLFQDAEKREQFIQSVRDELDPLQEITFQPTINQRSKRLAMKKMSANGAAAPRVFERLYNAKQRDLGRFANRRPCWI